MTGSLVGTAALVRLAIRLNRVRLAVWLVAVVGIGFGTASAFRDLYPTVESRQALASTLARTPALIALTGPGFNLSSIGGLTAWRLGGFGSVMVALLGIFTVTHHTRLQEENGRLELVGSGRVGRFAPLAAALAVAWGVTLLIGLALGAALASLGEPAAGSLALGLAFTAAGWTFAAIASLTAQLSRSARVANGLAGAVLGAAFLLRAVGDSAGSGSLSFLSWLSPIGWGQQVRPFAGERWELFGLSLALTAVCTAAAFLLQARRDLGESLLASRPGPAVAPDSLRSSLGLAWRIHRGALAGWAAGLAILGIVLGSLAEGVGSLVGDNPQLAEIFRRMGGAQNLIASYFASAMGIVGLLAGAFAVQGALRLRSEEAGGRAEPLLATKVSRSAWVFGHLGVVFLGATALLAAGGISAALAHGVRTGDVSGALADLAPAAPLQLPAVAVIAALTFALFGLMPRASSAAWAFLAASVVLAQLGQILRLPGWLLNLSPFAHIPQIPVEVVTAPPLVALTAVAAGLVVIGLAGFTRRDVPE
jgi:ABC-2 type transport system permease protein